MDTTITQQDAFRFRDYMDLADELSDPIASIEDFTPTVRKGAQRFAQQFGLSFPPRMADAEEFYNRNRDAINARLI